MAQSPAPAPAARPRPNPTGSKPDPATPMRSRRFWITLAVLFAANFLITNIVTAAMQAPTVTISYNEFLDQLNAGNVTSVTSTADSITGTTRKAVKDSSGTSSTKFQTQRPAFASDDLLAALQQHDVTINARDPNASTPLWETLLFSFGPTILLVLGFLYLSRRAASAGAGGILGGFGQSRARLYDAEKPSVTFDDVAGIDEVKADLREVVDFWREPRPRPLRQGARGGAGDHLHRRAGRDRPQPGGRAAGGRQRRAGANAQPDPHRDGRLGL